MKADFNQVGLPGERLSKLASLIVRWFRHAQRLFHMLVGLAFLFFAMAGAYLALREWSYYRQTPSVGWWRFSLLTSFTVLLVILCLYTFGKARSVR